MSEEQKNVSLTSLMFLKEKRDGTIKGLGEADGRKQHEKIKPKDATYLAL